MKLEKQLEQLSRKRDGESDSREALEQANAEIAEADRAWTEIGEMLRNQEIPVPPAEVMWNDVRRGIRLAGGRRPARKARVLDWNWGWLAASAVVVVLLGFVGVRLLMPATADAAIPRVEWVEAELPGSSAMVYEDEASGAVVIWLMTPEADTVGEAGT